AIWMAVAHGPKPAPARDAGSVSTEIPQPAAARPPSEGTQTQAAPASGPAAGQQPSSPPEPITPSPSAALPPVTTTSDLTKATPPPADPAAKMEAELAPIRQRARQQLEAGQPTQALA